MSSNDAYSIGTIAFKGVTRKMFRNVTLILAVSMLVALLVFAMLFNKAVEDNIDIATKRLGADIVVVPSEAKDLAGEFILESKRKTFYMNESVYESIKGLPDIKQATYQIYLNTLASGCCSIDEGQVVAFDPKTDFVIGPWLVEGPPKLGEGEVYVGSYVYDYLGLIDTATLFGRGVKVVGHLKATGTGLDNGIFMRIDDLDKITDEALGNYKHGNISIIFLKTKEGVDTMQAVASIRDINPRIGIMTRGDIGADVRSTLKDILRVFSITILISSVLAIFLAWSTFTALANERRREVGILRAIGAQRSHIMKLFVSEAMIISLIGGLIGIGVGHYLIQYLASDFNLLTKLGGVSATSFQNVIISAVGITTGIVICLIGASIPIIRLARMEPLLLLKEE